MQYDPTKSLIEKRSFIRATATGADGAKLELLYLAALAIADPNAPTPPIDAVELKRRVEILATRAETTNYGLAVCRFCGKPKREHALAKHLRNCHALEVTELPASEFAHR